MTRLAAIGGCLMVFAAATTSCTWTRFDDVLDNPPVERLEAPSGTSSLGLSLATYPTAAGVTLAATASDHVVLYDLGTASEPSTIATSSQSCLGDNSCVMTKHLARLKSPARTDNLGCVAYGLGTIADSSGTPVGKLWLYCEGSVRRSLDLPQTLQDWLSGRVLNAQSAFEVASPRLVDKPTLVAALPDAPALWFYDESNTLPVELPSLPDNQKAGRALAMIPYAGGTVVAASSLTTDDTVWLFQVVANTTAALTGCIRGTSQLGRLLATGEFDSDDVDDLLVADASTVYVIAGSSLAALPANGTPTCIDINSTQIIAKTGCANLTDLNGCVGQGFASSISAANLDGIPPDELVVGVPDAVVRGESAAGAVFIYGIHGTSFSVADGLFVSSATAGDRLGTSVTTAPISNVDAVLAGAPGDNSVMEFFCNSLMPAESKSARCP